jgi:hypothetical protein
LACFDSRLIQLQTNEPWLRIKWDGQAKSGKCKARDGRAMKRTYVRRSSEAIAATQQLASFCDAIMFEETAKTTTGK